MCGWFIGAIWRARGAERIEEIAFVYGELEVVVVPFQHSPINFEENHENLRIVHRQAEIRTGDIPKVSRQY